MTTLTPGANAALSSLKLTVALELDGAAEPAALLLGSDDRARSAGDFVSPHPPEAPGLAWGQAEASGAYLLEVSLADVPADVMTVRIAASLPEDAGTFGQRQVPFVRVLAASGAPEATFEPTGLSVETSLILVELYRRQDAWKVRAIGQGYADGRPALLTAHGIDAASVPEATVTPVKPAATEPTAPASTRPGIRYERPDRPTRSAAANPAVAEEPGAPIRYERADRSTAAAVPPAHPAPVQPDAAQPAPAPSTVSVFQPQPRRPTPAVTEPQPLWDMVEKRPTQEPVRPIRWALAGAEFTCCERVRDLLPRRDALPAGIDKFAVAEQWALHMAAERGSGFEYTWRDPQDRRLDPGWATLRSALHEPATGRIVAAGHLTHQNFGTSPAYDLGAINGSNGLSWPEDGHTDGMYYPTECLYIGSTRTGVLAPVDSSSNVTSVDLDPITGTIAVLETLGSVGCISVYDGATGIRRRLTVIESIAGNEMLRFSLDGRWLLLPRYDGAHLCEVATGRRVRLPVKQCCWWPLADSTLLEVVEVDGRHVPRLFSLETNAFVHDFAAITLDGAADPGVSFVVQPTVSADGTGLLALAPVGVSPEHRDQHGVTGHLVRVSLADGRGHLVHPAVLDMPFPTERDVSEARWAGPYPYRTTTLGAALTEQLQPPIREHEYLAPGRYSPEALDLLGKSLNRAIDLFQQDQDVAYLMPEIVMSLITVHEDPQMWEQRSEWLLGLAATVTDMVSDGRLTGRNALAWLTYAGAAQSIATTGASWVSPTDAAWIAK